MAPAPPLSAPLPTQVVGCGGGGSNAVNRMVTGDGRPGVEAWVLNTDTQALLSSPLPPGRCVGGGGGGSYSEGGGWTGRRAPPPAPL